MLGDIITCICSNHKFY